MRLLCPRNPNVLALIAAAEDFDLNKIRPLLTAALSNKFRCLSLKATRTLISSVLVGVLVQCRVPAQEQEGYEEWPKKQSQEFQDFKDARDKEFTEFLKHEWLQMNVHEGIAPDTKPKPVKIPTYTPPASPRFDALVDKSIVRVPTPEPIQGRQPAPEPEKTAVSGDKSPAVLQTQFFGIPLTFRYDPRIAVASIGIPGSKSISSFWEALGRSNFEDLLAQLEFHRKRLNLNDWGYCLLKTSAGQSIFRSHNEATLFSWFMLSKAGYDIRVGFNGDRVWLLASTDSRLFDVPFLTMAKTGVRYYIVDPDSQSIKPDESISTYDRGYPGATSPLSFRLPSPLTIQRAVARRTLEFSFGGHRYSFPITFSRDAVDFFKGYPQTDFGVYFRASPSPEASGSLAASLRPLISGKSEREAVNILLRFVQTAFRYRTDPEQFGREKPLFPDETLYYEYSDCEDRAILFAYLVRSLTGLEVIGLDYPNHIATAVRFSGRFPGDSVTLRGVPYMICDPTYTNADVGVSMPDLAGVIPKVINVQEASR